LNVWILCRVFTTNLCSAAQMPPKPLDILRKGLKSLQDKVAVKKDHLLAQLADKKSITSLDKHWPSTTLRIFRDFLGFFGIFWDQFLESP